MRSKKGHQAHEALAADCIDRVVELMRAAYRAEVGGEIGITVSKSAFCDREEKS